MSLLDKLLVPTLLGSFLKINTFALYLLARGGNTDIGKTGHYNLPLLPDERFSSAGAIIKRDTAG